MLRHILISSKKFSNFWMSDSGHVQYRFQYSFILWHHNQWLQDSSEHNWVNISETICPEMLASRPLRICWQIIKFHKFNFYTNHNDKSVRVSWISSRPGSVKSVKSWEPNFKIETVNWSLRLEEWWKKYGKKQNNNNITYHFVFVFFYIFSITLPAVRIT